MIQFKFWPLINQKQMLLLLMLHGKLTTEERREWEKNKNNFIRFTHACPCYFCFFSLLSSEIRFMRGLVKSFISIINYIYFLNANEYELQIAFLIYIWLNDLLESCPIVCLVLCRIAHAHHEWHGTHLLFEDWCLSCIHEILTIFLIN